MTIRACCWIACVILLMTALRAAAEPVFAVRQGVKCAACHVNPTGGGLRNDFGSTWSQRVWPARHVDTGDFEWSGALAEHVVLGGNVRASASYVDVPNQDSTSEFDLNEARLYLLIEPLPGRLAIYVDELVGPGSADNRELWAQLWWSDRSFYLKAGQMYLPYGLRLEDDSAYVRQVPGINMTTPDRGVELGWEAERWSAQLAVTNGSAGAAESDSGKQITARAEFVAARWRAGLAASHNDVETGERATGGVFAGLLTGPVAWLAEADFVTDDTVGQRREAWAGLLEANWEFATGHNLKLTGEYYEPDVDVDEDEQNRWSVVWEYVPLQFVQLRLGVRAYDGIPQNDLQNRTLGFLELNAYF
jgi:hypothetical protein